MALLCPLLSDRHFRANQQGDRFVKAFRQQVAGQPGTSRIGLPSGSASEGKTLDFARMTPEQAMSALGVTPVGLTSEEAEERLERHGPNELSHLKRRGVVADLLHRLRNPLVIQMLIIALVSGLIGEVKASVTVSAMIFLSVGLSFVLDRRSSHAVESLGKRIQPRAYVLRDGKETEVRISEVVPGDIVLLQTGSVIPADLRVISAKDFFVSESALTGESMPVEKTPAPALQPASPLELPNTCFLGSSVISGIARSVVVNTGSRTLFGAIAEKLAAQQEETAFDRGVRSFTWLMLRFMLVLVALVFLIVGLTKGNWIEALLFALSISVGLTPQMLPMILTVNLAKGALAMAKKKVIVKQLPAIQNFGAIDILCTDKTGTLTQDRVVLERHVDILGNESEDVLNYAYLNSYFQTGLRSLIDRAILDAAELDPSGCRLVDELPFDFQRRRMSVVVEYEGDHVLICKGAVEEIYSCCSHYQIDEEIYPLMDIIRVDLFEEVEDLNRQGFRVLGIAYREFDRSRTTFTVDDERNLVLLGYIAFYDPPKETTREALELLRNASVQVKILTGDNGFVTEKVCEDVGLEITGMVRGSDLAAMSPEEFARTVEAANIFVKLTPAQKEEIIRQLRAAGHVVGYMGDGINDAPALKAADVGIAVDSGVDVAKESADIILLEKSLLVLEEGILEGRRVFANIIKYIRMGASSNFGNMFSVVGASYLLPFLPMQPAQILANNLLYDLSQTGIPTDNVDQELIARPLRWNVSGIKWFMVFIGPISSLFDYATFALMWFVFNCRAYLDTAASPETREGLMKLFQTGWFVESLLTQTLIVHVIRTRRFPFIGSRASAYLMFCTMAVMAVGAWLPYSPLGAALGMVPLPLAYWIWILAFLTAYAVLTHSVKIWFINRFGDH